MKQISDIIAELNKQATPSALTVSIEQVESRAAQMAKKGYKFTEKTFGFVRQLCLGRGLMLQGDVGTGKSFFFYCAGIPALNMKVAQSMELKAIVKALDDHQDEPILIDDIGVEEDDYKSYGTSVSLLDLILEKRADSPAPTHFTTNLSIGRLQEKYGDRNLDRIRGMAVFACLEGESKRDVDSARRKDAWFADFYLPRVWELCSRCCGWYDRDERRCLKGKTKEPRAWRKGNGYEPEPSCPFYN